MKRHRDRGRRVGIVGVVLIAALATALAVVGREKDGRPVPLGITNIPMPEACGEGASPHDAASLAAAPLASDSNMTYSVWCGDELVEEFNSGVSVILQPNPWPDPAANWKEMAGESEQGGGTSVGSVQGVPAFEQEINPANPNLLGSVFFVVNNVYVMVLGDGTIPLKNLLVVAESVKPSLPVRVTATAAPTASPA
jgi:hypothetical protein